VWRKRAEYEQSQGWAERVREGAQKQLEELAWHKKQAELARQRLRAMAWYVMELECKQGLRDATGCNLVQLVS
jgi:hypothetical protein